MGVVVVGNEKRVELDAGEKCSLVGVPADIMEKRGFIGCVYAILQSTQCPPSSLALARRGGCASQ